MAKFHKLKVTDVRQETADCVSIAMAVPEELKGDYTFIQGQYLTFKIQLNGEEIRRSYSICSSPSDQELRIAAKKVENGRGSTFLNESVKVGDELDVMTPMGNFYTTVDASHNKQYTLMAGGSGITPMMSIIKTILTIESNSFITLIYANRDEGSIIFRETLESLASAHPDQLNIIHILDKPTGDHDPALTGIVTPELAKSVLESHANLNSDAEVFICGPTPMMDNARAALEDMGVSNDHIHIEYFTAVLDDLEYAEETLGQAGEFVEADVTVIMDDEEFEFKLASDGKVILEAAEDAGVDAPFSCKGAVCCTCKGQVVEGKVHMDKNFALSDSEVEQGYILTCQSHPASEKVVVTYDVI